MAEKAYNYAISLNKENLTSLGNLALLLNTQGRINEAQPIEGYIHKIRKKILITMLYWGMRPILVSPISKPCSTIKKLLSLMMSNMNFSWR